MDGLVLIRTFGALALLLGLLSGALWAVRRFDIRLPGAVTRQPERRLELVERLGIDQRRSAILIRRDDREHLLIISPEGHVMVETLPCLPKNGEAGAETRGELDGVRRLPTSFTALLDRDLTDPPRTCPGDASRASKRKH